MKNDFSGLNRKKIVDNIRFSFFTIFLLPLLVVATVNVDGKTLYYDDFDGTKGDYKPLE